MLDAAPRAWSSVGLPGDPRGGLGDIPFVAFDTETTGLGPSARLVELAAVRFRADHVEDEWSCLVNPGVPIPPEVTAIHGIRDEDVSAQPRAEDVLEGFLHFVEGAALVAHNAPFDIRILSRELLRAGMALPDNPVLDTCAIPRRLQLKVPNHRLGTLAGAFCVPRGQAHRALADARVTRGLLCAYLKTLGPAAEGLVRTALTHDGTLLTMRRFAGESLPETPLLALLRRAKIEQRSVCIVFRGGSRGSQPCRVRPRDLYALGGACYLEAECVDSVRVKTFCIDRIVAARLDQAP